MRERQGGKRELGLLFSFQASTRIRELCHNVFLDFPRSCYGECNFDGKQTAKLQ